MKKRKPNWWIKKKSKKVEAFSENKYQQSLMKCGLSKKHAKDVFLELGNITKYFTTTELNNKTYKLLLKRSKVIAANYNLKQALYQLGPTGYPFEILCSYIFRAKGFKTKVSVVKNGEFVKHEVDVVAIRDDKVIYTECKFHSKKHHKNDIKIPLYIHSRYLDLKAANKGRDFTYCLMTNTSFSKDAITYSNGVGLELYSMNYPLRNNFIDMIQRYKIYPVSVLHSLRVRDKKLLLEGSIVVVKQITEQVLEQIGLEYDRIQKVLQEVKILTRPN